MFFSLLEFTNSIFCILANYIVRLKTIFVKIIMMLRLHSVIEIYFVYEHFSEKKDKRNNSYNLSYNRQTNNKIGKKIKIKITQYIFC